MYCVSFDDRTMVETDFASRQRLRPWLIARIDSGSIPGLEWLNDEKTKFKIPWKHAGKQGWDPSCSQIFTVRATDKLQLPTAINLTHSQCLSGQVGQQGLASSS